MDAPSQDLDRLLAAVVSATMTPIHSLDAALDRASEQHWSPVLAAVAGGAAADRLGFAFVAGYQAALRVLVGAREPAGLCATEEAGAHPRHIATTIADGRLDGVKRWATLAPRARVLYVLASAGERDGRKLLKLVRVTADLPGVTIQELPATPFVPEIPHAEVRFSQTPIAAADILAGDGWNDYVKPFRTLEDTHVHAALLGHLLAAARAFQFGEALCERLIAAIVTCVGVAALEPRAPATHLALAGLIADSTALVEAAAPGWQRAPDEVRTRWLRDRPLLAIAARAREARRVAAWQAVQAV